MHQEHRLTIAEAARMVGVSAKALRLWEAKGLIPALERTDAGYRLYTTADLAALRFIRQAKALGLTLGEIKAVIELQRGGTVPCPQVMQLIEAHIVDIERVIADLQQLRQSLLVARSTAGQITRIGAAGIMCPIIASADDLG